MDRKYKYKINQALRIKESHSAYGIEFLKGQIVWVYPGESYGVEADGEIPILYSENEPFVCIKDTLLEPYIGNPEKLLRRVLACQRADRTLAKYQQKYREIGMMDISIIFLNFRKELYIKITAEEFKWSRVEAERAFDEAEKERIEKCIMPYEINSSKTLN